MADLALSKEAFVTVINDDAALSHNARAAGDLTAAQKLNAVLADAYLTVQFDVAAPAAGAVIAELYVLHGDGEVSESFPQGGDAGVGTDVDPQKSTLVGVFETRSPSLTSDETLILPNIPLRTGTDRFVLKNVSGQQFDITWQLDLALYTLQSI